MEATFCLTGILICILVARTRILKVYESLGVYRSGKLHHISGPGIVVVIPFLETSKKINLIESTPNLRSLTPDALDEKLLEIIRINGEVEFQKDYDKEFFQTFFKR